MPGVHRDSVCSRSLAISFLLCLYQSSRYLIDKRLHGMDRFGKCHYYILIPDCSLFLQHISQA